MDQPLPTYDEVREQFAELASGVISRSDAAAWAASWLKGGREHEDELLDDALSTLVLADGLQLPDGYLYQKDDFAAWLADFDANVGH